jgi:hypothetical protein
MKDSMLSEKLLMKDVKKALEGTVGRSQDYEVAAALGQTFTKVSMNKVDIVKSVEEVSGNYLVDAILTQFVEDALTPDIDTADVLTITSKKPKIRKELEILDERFGFDELVTDIAFDVLRFGEFILEVEKDEKEGVTDLLDSIDQTKVIPITRNGEIQYYLYEDNDGTQIRLTLRDPADFVKFTLGKQRIRIDLFKEYPVRLNTKAYEFLKQFPRYIRIGKSVIFPVLEKIKELMLLESLVPASKLAKLTSGTVIGVQVPANMDVEEALKAMKKIEGVLNAKVGVDTSRNELAVADIITSSGALKCVPIFGDKGTLSRMDFRSDEPDDLLASIKDLREVICTSIGYPVELLFSSEGDTKGTLLKRYARYLRVLRGVQRAVIDGLHQLIAIHLVSKGIDFVPSKDIEIDLRNKLLNIDNTESLEFLDTSVGMLRNVTRYIDELNNAFGNTSINTVAIAKFVNDNLGIAGIEDAILVKEVEKVEKEEEPKPPQPQEGEPAVEEPAKEEEPEKEEPEKEAPPKPKEEE